MLLPYLTSLSNTAYAGAPRSRALALQAGSHGDSAAGSVTRDGRGPRNATRRRRGLCIRAPGVSQTGFQACTRKRTLARVELQHLPCLLLQERAATGLQVLAATAMPDSAGRTALAPRRASGTTVTATTATGSGIVTGTGTATTGIGIATDAAAAAGAAVATGATEAAAIAADRAAAIETEIAAVISAFSYACLLFVEAVNLGSLVLGSAAFSSAVALARWSTCLSRHGIVGRSLLRSQRRRNG